MNERKLQPLLLSVAAVFYLAFIAGTSFLVGNERYFTLVDDAMISMRYAKHLAGGFGLVWNIGEAPIEGFTNPGWTLYMGMLHLLPVPQSKISLLVMLTAGAILIANLSVVWRLAKALEPDWSLAPVLAATISAFYFPLVFWSLRGMELGLLSFLINLGLLWTLTNRKPFAIGTVLGLAILVRMDAIIAASVIIFYLFFKQKRAGLVAAIIVLLATGGLLWVQLAYFGNALPLTYYQKVTGYSLLERAHRGLMVFNQFATRDTLFLLLSSLGGLFFYKMATRREALLLLGIFLAQCAYSIQVGGDYAEIETNAANRFITLGMPALILLFSWLASKAVVDLARAQTQKPLIKGIHGFTLALGVVAIISGEAWFDYALDNAPLLRADMRRVRLGLHIAEYTDPQAVVAVHAAGQIPYYAERRTLDLLGLNDPVIAKGERNGDFYPGHNKWNYEYSISTLKPDLIADNFEPLAGYMKNNGDYIKLANGIHVRRDSTLVDMNGIALEFKE